MQQNFKISRPTSEYLRYASKCAISRLKITNFLGRGRPSAGREGDTPSPQPTSSAPRPPQRLNAAPPN